LEDNIKINLTEIGGKSVYWIQMNEYRVQWWAFVKTVMNL
jgi:hypothetical protein